MPVGVVRKPAVLVVDDELLIRDLLYDFFSSHGWQITVAESGEKALEVMQQRKVDLLLTDIKMPEIDGLTLAEQAKKEHPDLPVILMTGYPSVETAVAGLRLKVDDYVIKPFNIHQLHKLAESKVTRSVS